MRKIALLLTICIMLSLAACGRSEADMPLTVGSNVDAISGATVSTKGVTTGVNAALAVAGVMG